MNPCRSVQFSLGGDVIFTGSANNSILILDSETGKTQARKTEAHEAPVSRLVAVSEQVMASGHEDGVVKLWDLRQEQCIASVEAHGDYVSDMYMHEPGSALLTTSGEGTLALIDTKTNKLRNESEGDADDELLSVCVIKNGKKVVCGTTSGVLAVWSWGYWEDCSDRFPGHPESVSSLIKFDEDTLLTGSSDGMIRIVQVQPNKLLGMLGEHGDLDIERMACTTDMGFLASASHDNSVKIWNLNLLVDDDPSEQEAGETKDDQILVEGKAHLEEKEENDSDSSSDDSDTSDDGKKKRRRKKKDRGRGDHRIPKKQQHKTKNFFADLL